MKKTRLFLPIAALLLAALACNFPGGPAVQPTSEVPPVDLTITALFKTAAALPPTHTPTPQFIPTNTSQPLATQPPPAATNTSAPAPSATQVPPTATKPPPTATQPPVRPGARVNAAFISPTLDGNWNEWKDVGTEYPAKNVVFGKSNWANSDDLEASYYVGWDLSNLYIAAKVHDDKYVQVSQGENIFKGDSLEILIDLDLPGDFYSTSLSSDDYQIGISPGRPTIADGNREAYLWFPSGKAGKLTGVSIAALDEGTQYRVEAAIPWSVFGVVPYRGMRMGFAFSVSDDDLPGEAAQQSMVSSAAGRSLADPTTWGEVTLK